MIIPFSVPFRIAKLVSKQALRIQIIATLRLGNRHGRANYKVGKSVKIKVKKFYEFL